MSRFDDIYPLFPEYDMYAQSVELIKEPNVFKARTPFGSYICKRTSAPQAKLHFVGGILRHLQQRGWDGAVPFTYTKYDEPFLLRGNRLYYVTPWYASVDKNAIPPFAWSKPTIERLAELHHLTQNYRFDDPKHVEPLLTSLTDRWQMWLDHMQHNSSIAQSRPYPSPFDVVFLANHAFIHDAATRAIESLKQWGERQRYNTHFRLSVIHGYPHPAHVLLDRMGKARLVNFDRAAFDTPARDLTLFFRAFFHLGGEEEQAYELLQAYQSVFPLRQDEMALLVTFLQYPERVMRDIEGYYNQKYDWNELQAVKRLEKDIDRLYNVQRFSEQLLK